MNKFIVIIQLQLDAILQFLLTNLFKSTLVVFIVNSCYRCQIYLSEPQCLNIILPLSVYEY